MNISETKNEDYIVVTVEQRRKLLRAHNELAAMLRYAEECHDLNLSHLDQMGRAIHILHDIFEFAPKTEDGVRMWWAEWVFAEENPKDDDDADD